MTPITILMQRLANKPLYERIHLLRLYLSYEVENSVRWKELYHCLRMELIKQLNREDKMDHRASKGSRTAEKVTPASESALA